MTWSLKLKHGELERNGSQLAKAINDTKLVQDLRIQFLQKMGIDDLHPEFGSLLDGGVTPDGVTHNTIIGSDDKELAKLQIQNEINRIIGDYQQRQLVRAKRDKMTYGKATLTSGEVILGVGGIQIVESRDSFKILINLTTGNKGSQVLELSVGN